MVQFIISHWNTRYLQEAIKLDIVEIGLASHVEKFLIEMGAGFAFMGRQYHIEVSGDDYSRDSLPTIEEIEKELEMKQKNLFIPAKIQRRWLIAKFRKVFR